MIPKVIYYAWFGNNPLPNEVLNNIESWKKYNPDYEIVKIDESRKDLFNYKDYDFTKNAYKQKKWAFVSDVARLDVLYKNGGFYLDTDVEVFKPFEVLENYHEIWAKENRFSINSGLFMASEKKSINIKNILDIYKEKKFDSSNLIEISTVTIITRYFAKLGLTSENKYIQKIKDASIFPTFFFAPLHYWGGGKVNSKSYTCHKYSASWIGKSDSLSLRFRNILRYIWNSTILHSAFLGNLIIKFKYKNNDYL